MNMFLACQIVQDRQAAIIRALKNADIPFALFASNATYIWIESVDQSAVRYYRNIDLIANRRDSDVLIPCLEGLNLRVEERSDHWLLRNQHTSKDRWSDRVYFSGEGLADPEVRIPPLKEIEAINGVPVVPLPVLVEFQLCRFKLDDKVDLRDLIDVGLIDQTWPAKLPPELAARLQYILDTPEG